jgi:hypothetical protein
VQVERCRCGCGCERRGGKEEKKRTQEKGREREGREKSSSMGWRNWKAMRLRTHMVDVDGMDWGSFMKLTGGGIRIWSWDCFHSSFTFVNFYLLCYFPREGTVDLFLFGGI